MEWSPPDAMKAYLQTLHMCKVDKKLDQQHEKRDVNNVMHRRLLSQKDGIIEPQGLELISALAAGNKAKMILQIITSNHGITPSTVALAVAAKQTGGKLICIVPFHDQRTFSTSYEQLARYEAKNVVELRSGDPIETIKDLRNVDFAVIDCNFDVNCMKSFYDKLHINPKGAIIVANNVLRKEQCVEFVDQFLRGKRGVESSVTTLPLGTTGGQVIVRIKSVISKPQRRRHKRFLVTFDE